MDQRTDRLARVKRRFFGTMSARGSSRGWIAVLGLAILVGLVAACSGPSENDDASSAASSAAGRWTLPADVKAAGAMVRIPYVNAPLWTSAKACGGGLLPGSHVLGELLMDKFAQVSSVGGYSCRRNTADTKRMSVHGTGRALDVFIPEVKGGPNNAAGDKVANWLVENATSIGVQLIIWDRSMWRANGTNDVPYGGPIPHIDHIHVEITEASAAKTALWFSDPDGGTTDDADASADADAGSTDSDASDTTDDDDAGSVTAPDASSVKDASAPKPDAAAPPVVDSGADEDPTTETNDPGTDSANDDPGEQSSLPDRPESRSTPSADDGESEAEIKANAGCSAAPGTQSPGLGLAFVVGVGMWLRKRKKR